MVSLAEEIKLLSLPAPSKINLDHFEDDPTNARIISKDDINEDGIENKALSRSNLRNEVVILLGDEDLKYAGRTISRRDLLKLRGDGNLLQDDGKIKTVLILVDVASDQTKLKQTPCGLWNI
jgi:hypothetical protein